MQQELQIAKAERGSGARDLVQRIESSIAYRHAYWVYGFLLAGLLARLLHASGTYLHPDEALHFSIANKASWIETYRASLSLSHPPLFIFVLHAWRALGTSELWLRIPSVIAGVGFCWLTFKWLQKLFSPAVAWAGFVFVLFLPSCIDLSTEVRQYALLLAFCMGAAYLLELAFEKDSAACMFGSGLCLCLAIASHYSSFLFAAALGLYAVSRIVRHHPALKVIAAWEAGVIAAFGLAYFFYVSHLATLGQRYGGGSATHGWMAGSYLGNSYYLPGKTNPILFVFARTGSVFQYVFGQAAAGDFALLAFGVGVSFALKCTRSLTRFQLCVLLLFPFALNCAAALLRLYPYGGTRHSSFLIPFAVAGISVALVRAAKNGSAVAVVSAVLISLVCNLFPSHRENIARNHRLSEMTAAMNFIHRQVPAHDPIFTDYESSLMLGYYLCEGKDVPMRHVGREFLSFECGGHQVIATDWNTDIFTAGKFLRAWPRMIAGFNIPEGSRVWVTQMGVPAKLYAELNQALSADHAFGPNINIFSLDSALSSNETNFDNR